MSLVVALSAIYVLHDRGASLVVQSTTIDLSASHRLGESYVRGSCGLVAAGWWANVSSDRSVTGSVASRSPRRVRSTVLACLYTLRNATGTRRSGIAYLPQADLNDKFEF